jgi:hypothetical protein
MNPNSYIHRLIDQVMNHLITPDELRKAIGHVPVPGDPVAVPNDLVREVAESPELNSFQDFVVVEIGGPRVPGFTNLTMIGA